MEELTAQHPDVQQLIAFQRAIVELRETVERMEHARDQAMRKLDHEGVVNRSFLARTLGMTRGRVWQILNPNEIEMVDERGEPAGYIHLEDVDLVYQHLWEEAVTEWEIGGREGDPADYFDVEAVVRVTRK